MTSSEEFKDKDFLSKVLIRDFSWCAWCPLKFKFYQWFDQPDKDYGFAFVLVRVVSRR
jgi:hypothetical protein